MATLTTIINQTTGDYLLADYLCDHSLLPKVTFIDQDGNKLQGKVVYINENVKVLTSDIPGYPNKVFEEFEISDDVFWN